MLKSFTGLEVSEFDSLLSRVGSAYAEYKRRRLSREDRKRAMGVGRPFKLPIEDGLLMLLKYYKTCATSILIAFVFDLGHSNVLKDVEMLEPLVKG